MGLRNVHSYLLLLTMAGPWAGCSSDDGADTTFTKSEEALVAARLAGRYGHYDVVAYEAADMKTLIVSYGFTDLYVEDGRLMAKETFCHAEHRSDQPIITEMSDAATQAIKPKSIAVEISKVDGRYRLWRDETPTPVGIKLANPETESLPDDPNDPRISDDDGDGKPGITVHIKVTDSLQGELFIARREIFAYSVDEQEDGSLVGTVSDRSEQLVIGASSDIFLTRAEWTQHPDLEKSPIILKRVAGDWDCERLMKARPELFPPTPEVDW